MNETGFFFFQDRLRYTTQLQKNQRKQEKNKHSFKGIINKGKRVLCCMYVGGTQPFFSSPIPTPLPPESKLRLPVTMQSAKKHLVPDSLIILDMAIPHY